MKSELQWKEDSGRREGNEDGREEGREGDTNRELAFGAPLQKQISLLYKVDLKLV